MQPTEILYTLMPTLVETQLSGDSFLLMDSPRIVLMKGTLVPCVETTELTSFLLEDVE